MIAWTRNAWVVVKCDVEHDKLRVRDDCFAGCDEQHARLCIVFATDSGGFKATGWAFRVASQRKS